MRVLSSAKVARLIVSPDALVSVSEAARLLRCRDADARDAIRAAGIVRRVGASELVRWGDVVRDVAPMAEAEPLPAPRRVRRLKRAKL